MAPEITDSIVQPWSAILASRRYQTLFTREQFLKVSNEYFRPRLATLNVWKPKGFSAVQRYSFVAKVETAGFSGSGIGSSDFEILAIQKAISEAYERLVFDLSKGVLSLRTSNGLAAHPNLEKAKQNARLELFERDSILTHWLEKQPFRVIEFDRFPSRLVNWLSVANPCGWGVESLLLSDQGFVPTLTLIARNGERRIHSNSSGATLIGALYRGLTELERAITSVNTVQRLATKKEDWGPIHHLAPLLTSPAPEWMYGRAIQFAEAGAVWRKQMATIPEVSFDILSEGSLQVVRAKSAQVQDLFFGPTEEAVRCGLINTDRIKTENINLSLHICA